MADAELGIGTGGRGFEVRASLGPEHFGSGAMAVFYLILKPTVATAMFGDLFL